MRRGIPAFFTVANMKRRVIFVLAVLLAFPAAAGAKVFKSPAEAVKDAFPDAETVETRNVVLTKKQVGRVEKLAGMKVKDRLVSFYIGKSGEGKILGYAVIASHIVRTKPETFIVKISPEGVIKRIEIISFYEPLEYLPMAKWLELFAGKGVKDKIAAKKDIPNITGATLTARALCDAARKIIAIYNVVFVEGSGGENSENEDKGK